jgi:hypothetical protein
VTRRLLLVTVLACALVAPAGARAHGGPHVPGAARTTAPVAAASTIGDPARDPRVAAWLRAALDHWGASPVCPAVRAVRAQWLADPGVWAAAAPGGCEIALDPDFYPAPADLAGSWYDAAMCSVVAHEWGHLLGYPHSPDPADLMSPVTPVNVVRGCSAWPVAPSRARARRRARCGGRTSSAARRCAGRPARRAQRAGS